LFWPGTLFRINLFLKLSLFRVMDMVPCLSRDGTFGVCPLTFPALVSDP